MAGAPVDVGIITIVPEEMKAVIDLLAGGGLRKEHREGAFFYTGRLPADGGAHTIAATQQLKQGNRSVVMAFERLMQHFQPTVIVLLGIGGSIHTDVQLGDVVIADQVVWYEQATVDAQGDRWKGEASELAPVLRALLNDFFANQGYPYELPPAADAGLPPARAYLGPIGSGEKVVRFRDAAVRQWLTSYNYKTLALETEAGGLAQAFYEGNLSPNYRAQGYLVIRGISDHADAAKDDRHRGAAARNACAFLRAFLGFIPPLAELFGPSASRPALRPGVEPQAGTVQVVNVSGGHVGSIIGAQHHYGTPPAGTGQEVTLLKRLETQRGTLAHHLLQLAISGSANVRPEVAHGIREARHEIARIKAALRAQGIEPGDHFDDEG